MKLFKLILALTLILGPIQAQAKTPQPKDVQLAQCYDRYMAVSGVFGDTPSMKELARKIANSVCRCTYAKSLEGVKQAEIACQKESLETDMMEFIRHWEDK